MVRSYGVRVRVKQQCVIVQIFMCGRIKKCFYSSKLMRDPFLAISSTAAGPPATTVPWMKMATKPENMTMIWKTSVQITAFIPPWHKQTTEGDTQSGRQLRKCTTQESRQRPLLSVDDVHVVHVVWIRWNKNIYFYQCGVQGANDPSRKQRQPHVESSSWKKPKNRVVLSHRDYPSGHHLTSACFAPSCSGSLKSVT